MKQTICDFCGKEIKENKFEYTVTKKEVLCGYEPRNSYSFDLCEDCYNKLKKRNFILAVTFLNKETIKFIVRYDNGGYRFIYDISEASIMSKDEKELIEDDNLTMIKDVVITSIDIEKNPLDNIKHNLYIIYGINKNIKNDKVYLMNIESSGKINYSSDKNNCFTMSFSDAILKVNLLNNKYSTDYIWEIKKTQRRTKMKYVS